MRARQDYEELFLQKQKATLPPEVRRPAQADGAGRRSGPTERADGAGDPCVRQEMCKACAKPLSGLVITALNAQALRAVLA